MENHFQTFSDSPLSFRMIAIEGNKKNKPFKLSHTYRVRLGDFWMGEYPVTQALWAYVMQDTEIAAPSYFKDANRPVEQVSWEDIDRLFLPRLNKKTKDRRPEGTYYRLPTEAEWEYAARGGKYERQNPTAYSGSNHLDEVGWYRENSHGETQPVGLKKPNRLGIYEMSGNVWEWCSDWYDSYPDADNDISVNPAGPERGWYRVVRGGCWNYQATGCRSAVRSDDTPENRSNNVGFRLVLALPSI
ncbi:MAG: formylglycine-generating enzyme family protein [Spirosomataceae bacterium]